MIHDLFGPGSPIAHLGDMIIAKGLGTGFDSIRLCEGEATEGMEAVSVRYLVDGDLREVMKIPSQLRLPLVAHLRSMCDVDPVHHPKQEGSFKVRGRGRETSIVASFSKTKSGGEEVELQLTPSPPSV